MQTNFLESLRLLLNHEGGFSNNPADPGAATCLGVTQKNWEAFVGRQVTEADMRALTPEMVEPLYKTQYWDVIHGDDLPAGVDYCVFDACVNSGPSRAVKFLQDALGIAVDGILGPQTLAAVEDQQAAPLISAFTTARLEFMKSLPTWGTFGKGWQSRVEDVELYAKAMATS